MIEDAGAESKTGDNLKFAICAVIDLQGFSSHLEISGYDLRTRVGVEAIDRLNALEDALGRVKAERETHPAYFPAGIKLLRMNDSIVATMDLDDILLPAIGETVFRGL